MKIAIIDELHDIKRSGVYYSTEHLKEMFAKNNIACDIVGIKTRGKLYNSIICIPFLREFLLFPIWNRFMVGKLEKAGYDVAFYQCSTALFLIHKTTFKKVLYTRALLARRLSIYIKLDLPLLTKLIIGFVYPFIRFAESVSFKRADRIVASKQRFANYLQEHFRISKSKCVVVPQMIDIDIPTATKKIAKDYDLMFNGRLTPPKNWSIVETIAKQKNYKIAVVTPESPPTNLPSNMKIFHGVPNQQVVALLRASKVFIMPSHNEEGPRVTLEALACGIPVVASPEGSGEFIEEGINGLVVETNNVKDYIKAIDSLLADEKLRQKMAHVNPIKARQYMPEVLGPKYIRALTF